MALIHCPECVREVSDQATACPHCGYPLQNRGAASSLPASEVDIRLREALTQRGKIMAIKLCRELYPGMGLAEAKQKVEGLESSVPRATPSPTVTSTGLPVHADRTRICGWILHPNIF